MAKPICVIYYEVESIPTEKTDEIRKNLEEKFDDYHVLFLPTFVKMDSIIQLEVFNDQFATETTMEDLRKLIVDTINDRV